MHRFEIGAWDCWVVAWVRHSNKVSQHDLAGDIPSRVTSPREHGSANHHVAGSVHCVYEYKS